jgi:hypothetical protein
MKMTYSIKTATVLCFCLTLASSVTAQPATEQKGKLVGENKNWKVEVVSAEYGLPYEKIPWDSTKQFGPLGENKCYLFLKLHFEYKGPSGDVPGPRVTLVNEKNEKFSNSGNLSASDTESFEKFDWLMSATHDDPKEHKTISLKTGDTTGNPWIEFLIVLPTGSKDLRLIFGGEEIAGIAVNPTKLK